MFGMLKGIYNHVVNVEWYSIGAKKVRQETKETTDTVKKASQELAKTKVTTIFDKEGLVTGKKIEETFVKVKDTVKKTTPLIEQFHKALMRVAIVVPVWAAARTAMRAALAPIQEITKAFFELDAGLAKVMTTVRASTSEQKKFYGDLAQAAWKYYATSTASMKDITEAMYQIGRAGGSTTDIMTGFSRILNMSIATYTGVETAAKSATGVLLTYGDTLTNLVTRSEKMAYITDLLTYASARQQLELNDIASVMSFVGSTSESLNIDIKTLIGTLGFLSTRLLDGRRAGIALMEAFSNISRDVRKLRDIGVVFDPRKPLDFIDILTQLRERMLASGNAATFTADVIDVFGRRGAEAILRIINSWDEWTKVINISDAEFQNFAERTRQTVEETLLSALTKFIKTVTLLRKVSESEFKGKNPLTEFFVEQTKAVQEAIDMLQFYRSLVAKGFKLPELPVEWVGGEIFKRPREFVPKELIEKLKPLKEFFELIGEAEISAALTTQIKDVGEQMSSAAEQAKFLLDHAAQLGLAWEEVVEQAGEILAPLFKMTEEQFAQCEYLKIIYEYRKKNFALVDKEAKAEAGLTASLRKKIEEGEKELKYSLMKIAGAKEEEIAYIRIVDKVKELNELAAQENERRRASGQQLYAMINITDVLAGNWDKILRSGSLILDKEQDILEIEKLRNQIQMAIVKRKEEERSKMASLAMQYERADMFEKSRIRRAAELAALPVGEFVRAYEESTYDKNVILDYWSYFREEGRRAIEDTVIRTLGFPLIKTDLTINPSERLEQLVREGISLRGVGTETKAVTPMVNINTTLGDLVINIPGDSLERMADNVAYTVKQKLLTNPELQKAFADAIRNYL